MPFRAYIFQGVFKQPEFSVSFFSGTFRGQLSITDKHIGQKLSRSSLSVYCGWFYLSCRKVKTPKRYPLQTTATQASINNEKSLLGEMAHPGRPTKITNLLPPPPQEAVPRSFSSSGLWCLDSPDTSSQGSWPPLPGTVSPLGAWVILSYCPLCPPQSTQHNYLLFILLTFVCLFTLEFWPTGIKALGLTFIGRILKA